MSAQALGRSTTHVARKKHECMAGSFVQESIYYLRKGDYGKLTFSEWREIAKLKANNWKIVPGQLYERQAMVSDGDFYDFKCIPEIHKICLKFDLYPDY